MKKRLWILVLALCVLLLLPGTASANSPAPDPSHVEVYYKNLEAGTTLRALFAGEDGVFHPDQYGNVCTVGEYRLDNFSARCEKSDTQLCVEATYPDGTVVRSNVLPIDPISGPKLPVFEYNGKTNELRDRTGALKYSLLGDIVYGLAAVVIGPILGALALTLLIEFLTGLCFGMKPYRYVVIANLITNPAMNIVLRIAAAFLGGDSVGYWIALAILEALAVLIEILFYRRKYRGRYSTKRIVLFTVVANALSCAAGIAMTQWLW